MPEVPVTWIVWIRLGIEEVLGLALVVFDSLPTHENAPGAGVGLGLLGLVTVEVISRRLRERHERQGP